MRYGVSIKIDGEWEALLDFPTMEEAMESIDSWKADDTKECAEYEYMVEELG